MTEAMVAGPVEGEELAPSRAIEPPVSVVVPVRGRRWELRRLLESLERQRADMSGVEVVVVENGDRTHERWIPAHPWTFTCRYEYVDHGAHALSRNVGAAVASNPLLVFLDSDVVLERTALNQLVGDWRAAPRHMLMADVVAPPGARRSLATTLFDVPAYFQQFRRRRVTGDVGFQHFMACAFVVARDAFVGTGGFDAGFQFYGYEDTEFALRARRHLDGVELSPARVFHHKELNPARMLSRGIAKGRSAVHMVGLHPEVEDTMPLGVADLLSGRFAFHPGHDIAAVLRRADEIERWLANEEEPTVRQQAEQHGRVLYEEIRLFGRFVGTGLELAARGVRSPRVAAALAAAPQALSEAAGAAP